MAYRVTGSDGSLHSRAVPEDIQLITAIDRTPVSPARVHDPSRAPLRIGAVQHRWHPDPDEHREALAAGVPCKQIWRAVWQNMELPASER